MLAGTAVTNSMPSAPDNLELVKPSSVNIMQIVCLKVEVELHNAMPAETSWTATLTTRISEHNVTLIQRVVCSQALCLKRFYDVEESDECLAGMHVLK